MAVLTGRTIVVILSGRTIVVILTGRTIVVVLSGRTIVVIFSGRTTVVVLSGRTIDVDWLFFTLVRLLFCVTEPWVLRIATRFTHRSGFSGYIY